MSQAKLNDKVKVHYTGKLEDGFVFDTSANKNPLEFVIGEKKVIPGFEDAIIGMAQGEKKTIKIEAEKAYGPYRKELEIVVKKDQLPPEVKPEIGQQLQIKQKDNQNVIVMITKINGDDITIDANHPLAGKDLTFEVELVEIV
jgi:peptidylprolyl isomerase